jgi:type I restriction enzyme, R subunit
LRRCQRTAGRGRADGALCRIRRRQAALAWLESVGWQVVNGAEIAPGEAGAERKTYGQVILERRLRDALARLNPKLPTDAVDDAFRKLLRPGGAELILQNRGLHRLVVDGATVEYRDGEGGIRGAQARVIDFDRPEANDWLAVNQFSAAENKHARRPDVVLFVNGLPLAVIELKNAAGENATIWSAFQQLQTYQGEVPSLFATNALLVASDGVEARVGAIGAGREWFKPWRTIAGEALADTHLPELQVVLEGLCHKQRFLDLIRDFIVFEDDGGRVIKKMAGYHQFHAVQAAVSETLRAAEMVRAASGDEDGRRGGKPGDRRVSVVWHTQGSGKSLTMAF